MYMCVYVTMYILYDFWKKIVTHGIYCQLLKKNAVKELYIGPELNYSYPDMYVYMALKNPTDILGGQ